jgi:hypothetical protein
MAKNLQLLMIGRVRKLLRDLFSFPFAAAAILELSSLGNSFLLVITVYAWQHLL